MIIVLRWPSKVPATRRCLAWNDEKAWPTSRCLDGTPNAATRISSHSGCTYFPDHFLVVKWNYYFISFPLASPAGRIDEVPRFLICLFVFLLLCPSRAPADLLSRVLVQVHEADTGMPGQEQGCIQKGCTAVGCWDTKDSFRDCGRNFAAVTDELLSVSCLILPLPVL